MADPKFPSSDYRPPQSRGQGESEVVAQTKEMATQVAGQAKEMVQTRVAQQTSKSAGDLGELADALRRTSRDMEGKMAAPLMNKAADRLERVSQMLDSTDTNEIVRSVGQFARREPLLFLGGAFSIGILGARFLKSSASHLESYEPSQLGKVRT